MKILLCALLLLCILFTGCTSGPSDVQQTTLQVTPTQSNINPFPDMPVITITTPVPIYQAPIISVPTPEITHAQTITKYASVYFPSEKPECFEITPEPESQYASGSSGLVDTRKITINIKNNCQNVLNKYVIVQWFAPMNLPSYYGSPSSTRYTINQGQSTSITFTGKHLVTNVWGYLGEQPGWQYKVYLTDSPII